ncbi:MAG: adenylate/guanylate cyclase domain-containing protein [Desulfococcaceae bacterium]
METYNGFILVIDDDVLSRTIIASGLEENGYIVITADNGSEGLQKLYFLATREPQAVDLVLLDLLMPKMDGFDFLSEMKNIKILRHIPVIVTSGEMDQESIAKCLQMGAVDYLTKPCDSVLLLTRVKNVLQSSGRIRDRKKSGPPVILIVDDDPMYRMLLSSCLEEKGYIIAEAENGKQAWEMICAVPYDLVFLDLLMPEMNGFEVLSRVKADSSLHHIPVIVVSGEDDMDGIVRCIETGAADYLSKPFDPAILHARVNASLSTKRLHDQEQAYFKTIQEERQKSEELLLNILPRPIINRLKQGEEIIADHFEEVTVMFADIVGFTNLSGRISPIDLVTLLNAVFSAFDHSAACYGLEKIKTIGDAYMVVGGLPIPRPDHAEAVAGMALEMLKTVTQLNTGREKNLSIRIGIHTGPVIAGIIGTHKFSYDLWGDTVNIASRMESHGVVNGIHVSSTVHERLKEKYLFEKRGMIQIKGKGEMETWLLLGQKDS